jgi:hypothetical protein
MNTNNMYVAEGVVDKDGNWGINVDTETQAYLADPDGWFTLRAQCYAVKTDPSTFTGISNTRRIHQ